MLVHNKDYTLEKQFGKFKTALALNKEKNTLRMSSSQQKLIKHTKKQENMPHSQEKKNLTETTTEELQTLRQNTEHFHVEIKQYNLKGPIGQKRNHKGNNKIL